MLKCVRMQIEPSLSSERTRALYVWCETCKVKVDCFSKHKRERPQEECVREFVFYGSSSRNPFRSKGAVKSCRTCDVIVKCFIKHVEEVKYDRMQFE